jgi:predicted TIM-barrel fold metal-dependent hydrolase
MATRLETLTQQGIRDAVARSERLPVTFLPEPPPRPRTLAIVSVDDHLVEPPDLFQGRMPKKFEDAGPRVIETENGTQLWKVGEELLPNIGLNAVVGRPQHEHTAEPTRFDEMRRGTWEIEARLGDMDIDGVWASLCFPSALSGFAGWRWSRLGDQEFGLACMRAWNDWHIEVWAAAQPERIIPCQITWLNDPEIAASEIIRNAERGFRAVTFSQAPHQLGFPSLHSGHWDPVMRACEETETVICLHFGTGRLPQGLTAPDGPSDADNLLLPFSGVFAVADWLFSKVALRFPNLKIALSECGIGWVPFCIDRLDHMETRRSRFKSWQETDVTPTECLRRNFYFCALGEKAGFEMRDFIGVDHILVESDYPHEDSTWPDTQTALGRGLSGLPAEDVERMTCRNAAELFRKDLSGLEAWRRQVPA